MLVTVIPSLRVLGIERFKNTKTAGKPEVRTEEEDCSEGPESGFIKHLDRVLAIPSLRVLGMRERDSTTQKQRQNQR